MRKLILLIIATICLTSFNNIYAKTADSLAIIKLKEDIEQLKAKTDSSKKVLNKQLKDSRFIPVRFTIGPIYKGFGDYIGQIGIATKFSFKQWNYKHYIYADLTLEWWDEVNFALGYLYNINNYFMLGASFDVLTVRPAIMLSITNSKYFSDYHLSFGKNGMGGGLSIGMCF